MRNDNAIIFRRGNYVEATQGKRKVRAGYRGGQKNLISETLIGSRAVCGIKSKITGAEYRLVIKK